MGARGKGCVTWKTPQNAASPTFQSEVGLSAPWVCAWLASRCKRRSRRVTLAREVGPQALVSDVAETEITPMPLGVVELSAAQAEEEHRHQFAGEVAYCG